PVHANTSWDAARFEVCAHRYLRVAEGDGFGVAVVNSATYGHDVVRVPGPRRPLAVVRPTLLRGPRFPDPGADLGQHSFSFQVVLGVVGEAVAAGFALAAPPRRLLGGRPVAPIVSCESDGVVIDTVKAARDGSGDVILRLYQARGGRVRA